MTEKQTDQNTRTLLQQELDRVKKQKQTISNEIKAKAEIEELQIKVAAERRDLQTMEHMQKKEHKQEERKKNWFWNMLDSIRVGFETVLPKETREKIGKYAQRAVDNNQASMEGFNNDRNNKKKN